MTKLLLLTGFALLISTNLIAALKKAEGYYISAKSGRKYPATFLIPFGFLSSEPNYERMQSAIIYLLEEKRHTLTPEKVSEVSFTYKNKTTLMRSVFNTLSKIINDQPVFFNVVVDGPVTLYHYYESNNTPVMMNPTTGAIMGGTTQQYMRLVLQREGSELVRIRNLFFRKDVSEFFSDCPDLVQKIQSGKLSTLEEIVRTYNDTCLEISN